MKIDTRLKKSSNPWVLTKLKLLAINIIFLGVACQSLPFQEGIELPTNYQPLFHSCADMDGSSIFFNDKLGPGLNVDWISDAKASLRAEARNPLGQTLISAKIDEAGIFTSKPLKSPELALDEGGFVRIDGYFSGLHRKELACLMGFYLPGSWRSLPAYIDLNGGILFKDQNRSMRVNKTPIGVDTEIRWSTFILFGHQSFKMSLDLRQRKTLKLFLNDKELGTWTDADGDNF